MSDRPALNSTTSLPKLSKKTTTEQEQDSSTALWPLVLVLADIAQRVASEQARQLADREREQAT